MDFFSSLGLVFAVPAFVAAAVAVWIAGTRITGYANTISKKTGMGDALIGILLLGGITSLPELAVTVSASFRGNAPLAVNNILGGVAMQVAILAFADSLIGRRALTSVVPDANVILQGALGVLLLSIVAAAIMVGDVPILGIGVWMWLLAITALLGFRVLARAKGASAWIARGLEDDSTPKPGGEADKEGLSLHSALVRAAIAGAVIVVAGYVLSETGSVIADKTGLGQSFVGAVLVSISTSLPEISTVTAAVRSGLYTMAMSDIFGTNLFDVMLLFVADAVEGSGAVMKGTGAFSGFAAIIGITVTALFMAGLAERRDRTVLRMGYDSLAVLGVYLGGLVVLYFLK